MLERYALIKAMKIVLGTPEKKFSVRSLAKESQLSVSTSKQCLDHLYAQEMIKLEKVGATYQYQADLSNYLTKYWKIIFNLEEIKKERIVAQIIDTMPQTISISLYGSLAKGTEDKKSDVDLIIITNAKETIDARMKKREVNCFVFTPHEWRKKAGQNKVFYEQVVLNCIELYGEKPVVL